MHCPTQPRGGNLMRYVFVGLFCLFALCLADAAPAPLPKRRVAEQPPSDEVLAKHLDKRHGLGSIGEIERRGPREWLVSATRVDANARWTILQRKVLVRWHG